MSDPKLITEISGSIHNEEQFPILIEGLKSCKYYAYIFHDSDLDDNGQLKSRHIHFVAQGRHSLKKWSKLLGIPDFMIELPNNFRSCNRYLIHIDDPKKFQYDKSLVITNRPIRFECYLTDNSEVNPKELYRDLTYVKKGVLSSQDFLDKYAYYINSLTFLSQFNIFKELSKYEQ